MTQKAVEYLLDHGIKLVHEYSASDELVAVSVWLPIGIEHDEQHRDIGSFTCAMLLKGTERHDAEALAFALEEHGMTLEVQRNEDAIHVGCVVHRHAVGQAMDLLWECLTLPSFPVDKIEMLKEEYCHYIRSRYDHISTCVRDAFIRAIYGDTHPYAWPALSNEDAIRAITRDTLIAFHKNYFVPSGTVVSVVGNCTAEEIAPHITRNCTNTQNVRINDASCFLSLPHRDATHVVRQTKKFQQAFFAMGTHAPSATNRDYCAAKIVNEYMGHGMTSRLFTIIREERGLAYETGSLFPSRRHDSFWMLYAGLDPTQIDTARNAIEQEIALLQQSGIAAAQRAELKTRMVSAYVLDHQTKARRAWYYGFWETLGKKWQFDIEYSRAIEAVTPSDITRAIHTLCATPFVHAIVEPKA